MGALQHFITVVRQAIVEPLITLLALAAFLVFLWGVVDFIRAGATGEEKKDDGKRHMFWGLVGLAIIFSANALISLIAATVGR